MELIKDVLTKNGSIRTLGMYGRVSLETILQFSISKWCGCVVFDYPNPRKTAETIAIEMIKKLVEEGHEIKPKHLNRAIYGNYFELSKYLVDSGCPVNGTENVPPALSFCCKEYGAFSFSEEEEEFINFLLSKGANIHQKMKDDKNLLVLELDKTTVNWLFVEKLLRLGVKPPRRIPNEHYTPFTLTQLKIQYEKVLFEVGRNGDFTGALIDILRV